MTHNRYALEGKTALVTGAGTGMGRAITQALIANGARVVITGRREDRLRETVVGVPEDSVAVIPGDVADRSHVEAVIAQAKERFGGLDIVVSNAGAYAGGDITELSGDDWVRMRATNVDAFVTLSALSLPELERRGGNFIAIASASGLGGDWGQAAYNATKHAVVGFVRSLALDWGSRGVRVNAVAPAFTLTELTAHLGTSDEELRPFVNRIALGRPGQAEDVVGATLFLASPDAAYITGAVLSVDGGTSASTGQPHIE